MRGSSIGCDLGGTSIKAVRLRGGQIERSARMPTPAQGTRAEVIGAITATIRDVAGERRAVPIGVAVPGFLDPRRRKVVRLSNLPQLDGSSLAAVLERRRGAPVILDADSNAGAVAEALLGAGRGFDRVLYVTLGTGLGAALVVGGEPARVANHTVGQVAHLRIAAGGPACRCGGRGCAESLLAARGLLARARQLGMTGARDPEDLRALAAGRGGTRGGAALGTLARQLWRETGDLLGRLLVLLASLFSPRVAVIGGGIAGALDLFGPAAERHLAGHLAPRLGARLVLRRSALGKFAGAAGMALLARGSSLSRP